MVTSSDRRGGIEDHAAAGQSLPAWFEAFLADRGTGKPSAHTMKPTVRTSSRSRCCSMIVVRQALNWLT
jgi:hypothetical protein